MAKLIEFWNADEEEILRKEIREAKEEKVYGQQIPTVEQVKKLLAETEQLPDDEDGYPQSTYIEAGDLEIGYVNMFGDGEMLFQFEWH